MIMNDSQFTGTEEEWEELVQNAAIMRAARVCHEANKAWCEANGDFSQKSWENAEDWQRDSAIAGVKFRLANPDAGDDAQHNAWMKDKTDNGWVYGPVKDAEAKTHPCIVAFNMLPFEQRMKDTIFCAIVDAIFPKQADAIGDSNVDEPESSPFMNFFCALEAIKAGKKLGRKGWNGKGMFVYLVEGSEFTINRPPLNSIFPEGMTVKYRPHIDLFAADGTFGVWNPSMQDILAEDWFIYPMEDIIKKTNDDMLERKPEPNKAQD